MSGMVGINTGIISTGVAPSGGASLGEQQAPPGQAKSSSGYKAFRPDETERG
jgi:hypothetical protein